jgi:hypothetical protein
MNSLIKELETITTIPEASLNKLIERSIYCICEDIEESKLQDDKISEIDIGIGTLTVLKTEDTLKYKFTPSAKLNDAVIATIVDGKNPLIKASETSLVNRITNVYKDLL